MPKILKIRTILILFLVSCSALSVKSQTVFKINQYNIIDDGRFIPVFTLYSGQSFNDQWGISAYFYVNGIKGSSWGEGLAGPTWTPMKGLTFGFLAGFQTNEDQLWRVSPIINYSGKKISCFGAFEYGGERHRWDVMAFYLINDFKIGGELIRFYNMFAAGPRVEYSFFKKQPITVFTTGLWDWTNGKPGLMFGIYSVFSQKK